MARKRSLVYIFIFSFFLISGNALSASNPKVSLVTCDAGNDLYSLFGHSAIRVQDSLYRIDRVYNYGIFDFEEPNFLGKFMQGKLKYMLGIQRWRNFKYQYEMDNRGIYEQVFNFTDAEAIQIVRFLDDNYLPANRYYLYDFFYNNCATKIRDILEEQLGEKLVYATPEPDPIPFRELVGYVYGRISWLGRFWHRYDIGTSYG